jgi:PAS domain S-box-containing protein
MVEVETRSSPRLSSDQRLKRALAGLKTGDHLCLIYETADEQFAAVVPFIGDGLARGERCLYVVDDRAADEVVGALSAAGVNVEHEVRRGALRILTKRDAYLKSGTFDPRRMITLLRRSTAEAVAAGFTGLRVTGEMTWALGSERGVGRLIEYEARLNGFLPGNRALAICQYNRRRFPAAIIREVLRTHPIAIFGDLVCSNPYYEPPAAVLGRQSEAKRVSWMISKVRAAAESEDAMRRSEERLREAQALAHLGSWELDLGTGRLTWSDEIYRIFEIAPGAFEASYEAFLDAVHPDDREAVDRAYAESVRSRSPYEITHRLLMADGRVKYVHERGATDYDEQGRPVRSVGTVQDVTERERREQEVVRLSRTYQLLSQTNQLMLRAGSRGELLAEACRIAVEVGGFRMAWVGELEEATRRIRPVAWHGHTGSYLDAIHVSAEDVPEGRGPTGTALREGKPVVCRDIANDPAMEPWRAAALAHGYRSSGAFPLRSDGRVTSLFMVYASEVGWPSDEERRLLIDMTDDLSHALEGLEHVRRREEAEEALRASEAAYRRLVDESFDGIYRCAPDGRFLTVNQALVAMLGYASMEEVLRLNVARDVCADPADGERLMSGFPAQEEVTWKRRDGSPLNVRLRVRAVHAPDGAIECYEGYVEDVSEKRALEGQLRHAQKMDAVGRFASGVAHDFNNLLATILACCDLVAKDLPREASSWEDLGSIRTAARGGAELTRKLLAFSRPAPLDLKTVVLGSLVADFARMARRIVAEDIELSVRVETPDATILADPGAVEQILMNLVTNARDAMPSGGRLEIAVHGSALDEQHRRRYGWGVPGDYVVLTVRDSGCGMDAETQRHLFEPFFTTKAVGKGTGLGMPMVYGLVKQQGGYIEVQSEPGRGTSVGVYFPPAVKADLEGAPTRGVLDAHGSETILVVEDNEELRRAAIRVLESYGYRVHAAGDGIEALRVLGELERPPDLIISDVVMPRVDGPQLLRALREAGAAPKVLFVSGHPEAAIVERMAGAGAPLLAKPWTGATLARKVREVLDAPAPSA